MTYSSSLALGRSRFAGKNQNTTRFVGSTAKRLGPVSNTVLLVLLACLLGLMYLTQVTKTNSLSYKLNDLRQQQTSLKSQNDQLTVDAARMQALEQIKNSPVATQLVAATPKQTIQN